MDIIVGRSAKYAGFVLRTTSGLANKFSLAQVRSLCHCDTRRHSAKVYDTNLRWKLAAGSRYFPVSNSIASTINRQDVFPTNGWRSVACSSKAPQLPDKDVNETPPQNQSIFQKMKQMTKDYWHILIPVHVVTSTGWISLFYMAAKNGVDIVYIMESLNLGDRYLDMLRGSNAGHWAVAYALYKLFTPIRYTVTVGGTTMTIRYLNRWGYLKFKPRSTIKETQSKKSAMEHRENLPKVPFKNQQQTEPPKT